MLSKILRLPVAGEMEMRWLQHSSSNKGKEIEIFL